MQKDKTQKIAVQGACFLVIWFAIVIALLTAYGYGNEKIVNKLIQERTMQELEVYGAAIAGDSDFLNSPAQSVYLDEIRQDVYQNQVFFVLAKYPDEVSYYGGASEHQELLTGNLWDNLESAAKSESDWVVFERYIEKRQSEDVVIEESGMELLVGATPIAGTEYVLLMGVEDAYLEQQEASAMGAVKVFPILIGLTLVAVIVVFEYYNFSTRRQASEHSKEMEDKADTDQLTGLYNKMATERKIKEYMQKYPDSQALMIIIDVDNFKKINDTMGHSFGDEVLSKLGVQVQAMFRVTDIIGRTGGDEFIVFLKRIPDEIIVREGKKLETFFKNFEVGEYVKYSVTASLGAAVFPGDAKDFEGLYKAADKALYVAKNRGKNCIAFYGEEQ